MASWRTFGLVPSMRNPTTCSGPATIEQVRERLTVLASRAASSRGCPFSPMPSPGSSPRSASTVGATSTSRHDAVDPPERAGHPRPPRMNGRPGLHHADGAVLAQVAALVLPVVRRAVEHGEVGSRRRVPELRHLVVCERIGVALPVGEPHGQLGIEPREPIGRLVGERVVAFDLLDLERPRGALGDAPDPHATIGGHRLVGVVADPSHHRIDDGVQIRVEQHLGGAVDRGGGRRRHRRSVGSPR